MTIEKTAKWYMAWTTSLPTALLVVCCFLHMEAYGAISAVFHILCSMAYIAGWRAIARRSPETLPKYYLAGSAFRLMAAAMVLLVFCVVKRGDTDAIKWFAFVFIVFYLVMLAFDAVFFAMVSKSSK